MKQQKPRVVATSSGSTIFLGRCATQNDELTLAAKSHEGAFWFHVDDGIPGAHVVLYSKALPPLPEDVTEAARLALLHSKAPNKFRGTVIFCRASAVEKSPGSSPGRVVVARDAKRIRLL